MLLSHLLHGLFRTHDSALFGIFQPYVDRFNGF